MNKVMNKMYRGKAQDLKSEFEDDSIKYGISIGRRAPMHRVHMDCIHEIAEAGLTPVIFIGSTNDADSEYFDPANNPLTLDQQKEQLKFAIPEYYDEKLLMTLDDVGDEEQWINNFIELASAKELIGKSVLHYRVKTTDIGSDGEDIRPIGEYMKNFSNRGLPSWQSVNSNPEDDNIHASDIRMFDLENMNEYQRSLIASPDYIIDIARQARKHNIDIDKDAPLTMMDLSMDRIKKEVAHKGAIFISNEREA